jgi:hypothetical protein
MIRTNGEDLRKMKERQKNAKTAEINIQQQKEKVKLNLKIRF